MKKDNIIIWGDYMKKSIKLLLAGSAVGLLAAESINLYKEVMGRGDRPQMPLQKLVMKLYEGDQSLLVKFKELVDRAETLPCEKFHIKSDRGDELTGFYWEPEENKHPDVIVIGSHGYRVTHKGDPYTYIAYYLENGYAFFAPDHVGAGESGGNYVGFDYFESQDLLKWIDFLKEKFGEDKKFILHGTSMGASTVMMLSGSRCPDCVKLIIEDCGFTSAKDEFEYILKNTGLKNPEPVFKAFNCLNKKMAKFDLCDTDVRNQVKNAKVPMLFIHGEKDDFVPTKMGYELYNLCPEDKRTLKIIPNAGHANSVVTDYDAYFNTVTEFLNAHSID